MNPSLETLQAEVMLLSSSDRAKLLDSLIASLDEDAEVEAAWDALADAREQALRDGTVDTMPLEDVMARLEARFPG
ncbi:MAG: addiction module protein [Thiobacillus sp.]|nr:addiction module protein [Thiobacillus sp.]